MKNEEAVLSYNHRQNMPTLRIPIYPPHKNIGLQNFLRTDYRNLGACLRQKLSITQEFTLGEYAWAYHID